MSPRELSPGTGTMYSNQVSRRMVHAASSSSSSSSSSLSWMRFLQPGGTLCLRVVQFVFVSVPILSRTAAGFLPTGTAIAVARSSGMQMTSSQRRGSPGGELPDSRLQFLGSLASGAIALALPLAALADLPLEKFKEGEICLERNLNGSCSKFGVAEAMAQQMPAVSKKAAIQEEPESELMTTLKRRTLENKARNDEEVATRSFINGQSGEFGPFSRYIPVKHRDTGKFELVRISELDGMRKRGLVENKGGMEYFTQVVK